MCLSPRSEEVWAGNIGNSYRNSSFCGCEIYTFICNDIPCMKLCRLWSQISHLTWTILFRINFSEVVHSFGLNTKTTVDVYYRVVQYSVGLIYCDYCRRELNAQQYMKLPRSSKPSNIYLNPNSPVCSVWENDKYSKVLVAWSQISTA